MLLHMQVHYYQLLSPELNIECPSEITRGKLLKIKIKFTNILQQSLTRVLFVVQGQALCPQRELSHKYVSPVARSRAVIPINFYCLDALCCQEQQPVWRCV